MTSTPNKIPRPTMLAAWTLTLAVIAPMLDATMVNIAVKALTQDFSTSLSVIQWGMTGYILALAVAVPISGWLMNHFNGKRVLILAVLAFGLTSVLAGLSWRVEIFIFFRLLQGFSAGIITPLMATLLVKTAGPENIGKVIAIVTTPMIFGPIFGPVLGGFIIEFSSWQWIFYINIAVVAVTVPLMMRNLPDFPAFNRESRLDIVGILLLAAMSVAFIFGVSKAADQASFTNPTTLIWLGLGFALLLAYIVYDHRTTHQTVLPLTLFRHTTFKATSIGLFLTNMAIMGPMLILPLFFQNMLELTTIEAALALMPQGLGMLITRPYIGRMIDQVGAKKVVLVSVVLSIIGSLPLILITPHTSLHWLSVLLFIRGMSIGGITIPLSSDAYTGLDEQELPQASVGVNVIENLGSGFGTALLATVVASVTVSNGILSGFHTGFLVSVIILALISLPALFLTDKAQLS
ncbi:MFS transporter [Bacilli bacterium]|nr:MFS transporter [Bacilli bacterium]GHU45790.1 MFS transporter [Bacilli bacterium]